MHFTNTNTKTPVGEEKKEGVGRTFLFFSRVYLLIYMVRERGREAVVGLRKLPTGCFDGKYNAKKKKITNNCTFP